ncbi:MAG: DUF1127 domain-containing protein [Gammaproteobacteria bacterium]|nr:DUF1127 domain-containing protein [Gammaproteobacteria bacterium]
MPHAPAEPSRAWCRSPTAPPGNRATRRELARLDHHLLRDIGLSRTDLAAEPETIIATRRQRIAEVARSVRGIER